MNDSTSPTSPAWPTSWPKDSFKGFWAWALVGFIGLLTIATGLAEYFASQMPMKPIPAWLFDASLVIQFGPEALVAAIVIWALPRISKFSFKELGFRTPTAATFRIALIGAVAMIVVADVGPTLIANLAHSRHEQQIVQIVLGLHDPASLVLFTVFAVIFAPFAEETFFRLLFFNLGLRYGGFWCGAIVSGVMFGIAHGDLFAALPLAAAGIVLCGVYYWSRNAYASMMSHACFNAFSTALLFLGPHLVK